MGPPKRTKKIQKAIELINRFLTNQTDIILRHGTVDNMGDCIMAFWNAPLNEEKHAEKAVRQH